MKNPKKFLKSIGIKNYKPWKSFWGGLNKRYGESAKQLLKMIGDRGDGIAEGTDGDIYKLKNSSLDCSLEVTSQYYSDIYQNYLNWFSDFDIEEPQRLIDLGCDNGVLTCFYATLYPESEIIGIDSCEEATICAKQLAEKLGLTNITFENKNLEDFNSLESLGEFDIVIATTVMHEFLSGLKFGDKKGEDRYFSLEEANLELNSQEVLKLMSPIIRLVKPESGSFISMDRWTESGGLSWWAFALNKAGISIDLLRSSMLEFKNSEGGKETLPLLVGRRLKESQKIKTKDILSLYDCFKFKLERDKYQYENEIAESFFISINPKTLLVSYEFEYLNGSGTHKMELWATDSLLLLYSFTNIGYRQLTINSLLVMGNIIETLNEAVEKFKPNAKITKEEDLAAIQGIFDRTSAKRVKISDDLFAT